MDEREIKENLSRRDKRFINARSIMDIGMGLLWTAMGIFLAFIDRFNIGLEAQFSDPVMKGFGVIAILYGIFRIYRGFKKKYFK